MPDRTTYDEAMRFSQTRLKIQDLDIKQGHVETMSTRTAAGVFTQPWGVQGGFAVVYKFRTGSGKTRAMRCFLVKLPIDTRFRYERMSAYFAQHVPDITVSFTYYDDGILLKETINGQQQVKSYPVIDMEWIEGKTLIEHLDELCQKHDQAGLADVLRQWQRMLEALRRAHIAHGDLAGVNIMVRQNGQLVLVDYDGVYLPDFAGRKQVVLGQRDYQHPQMLLRPFNERCDDFSALVILTALLALHARPELWNRYMRSGSQGGPLETNLLFKQQDFLDPDGSKLFAEIEQLQDQQVHEAVQALKYWSCEPIATVTIDRRLFSPDFEQQQLLARLLEAIQRDDDQAIGELWTSELASFEPAQRYLPRVELTRQRKAALLKFRMALMGKHIRALAGSYDATLLDGYAALTANERAMLRLASAFVQAVQDDDDPAIIAVSEEMKQAQYRDHLRLTSGEQERIELAHDRRTALLHFRRALESRNPRQIVSSYAWLLEECREMSAQEREQLRLAKDFVLASHSSDEKLTRAMQAIRAAEPAIRFVFGEQDHQRIRALEQRRESQHQLSSAFASKQIAQIAALPAQMVKESSGLSDDQRYLWELACDFVEASQSENDQGIAACWEHMQEPQYRESFVFSDAEQQRIQLATERTQALRAFRLAILSRNMGRIAATYDPLLEQARNLSVVEASLLLLARNFVEACRNNDSRALLTAWSAIQQLPAGRTLTLTDNELQRLTQAQAETDRQNRHLQPGFESTVEQEVPDA